MARSGTDARGFTYLIGGQVHARAPGEGNDAVVARLAAAQLGVAARQQLLDLGVSDRSIARRLASGRAFVVFPGVYALGHPGMTAAARALAAVLTVSPKRVFRDGLGVSVAAGAFAVASHATALALHGAAAFPPGLAHVTVTAHRRRRRDVYVHRSRLDPAEVEVVGGMPATTLARTIFDLARSGRPVRRLVKEAEFAGTLRAADLVALLDRYPRARGRRGLARVVEPLVADARRTRSELEDRFLGFCRRRGLPPPETNVTLTVGGRRYEADCVWRNARLVVELDGRAAHMRELAFADDRARDRALVAAGWVPVRVTSEQLDHDGKRLESDLRSALAAWPRAITHRDGG